MPSPYTPPDAIVTQQSLAASTPRQRPQLPVCLIGPSRQIEVDAVAGSYAAGTQLGPVTLPNLVSGATVDSSTIVVKFLATTAAGTPIGTFLLHTGTEALLSSDASTITVPATLPSGLEFSLFSSRNNNLDTLDDDVALGTADGIFFDDSSVDFASLGVIESLTVGSILVAMAPAAAAGRYRVVEMIRDSLVTTKITRLRLEKLNTNGNIEIHNRFVPNATYGAGVSVLRGYSDAASATYPAHIQAVSSGTAAPLASINVTAGGAGYSSAPSVNITGGGGTGATAVAEILGGVVVRVTLTAAGSGYTSAPSIAFTGGGSPTSTAAAQAVVATNFIGFSTPRNVDTAAGWLTSITPVNFNTLTAMSQARSLDDAESTVVPFGIGVEACLLHSASLTGLLTMDGTTALSTLLKIPETTSSATTVLAPVAPTVAGTPYASNSPFWKSLLSTAQVGDWLRFTGTFGKVKSGADLWTNLYLDYKITAIDQVNGTITIVNPDGLSTNTNTLSLTSATVSAISLLRCFRARNDGTNLNGDFVRVTISGTTYSIELLDVAPYRLTLASPLPAGVTSASSLEIHRGVRTANLDVSYDLHQVLTSGYKGTVTVSYEAARTDLALNGVMEVANIAEIESTLGLIHPRNPLALAADMATRSGGANGTNVVYVISVASDTVDGYTQALELASGEEMYHLVPLSQDAAVLSLFSAHVTNQSLPVNKHERRCYLSTALKTFSTVLPATGTTALQGYVAYTGTGPYVPVTTQFNAPGIDWTQVQPGQMISILATSSTGSTVTLQRRIRSVNAAGQYCTVFDAFPTSLTDPDGNSSTVPPTVYFRIDTYPYSKMQQAEIWRDEAKTIGNKRVTMVRPEACYLTYTDKTGASPVDVQIRAPMYYGAAALAGYRSTLSASQPVTNLAVPGVDKLDTASTYFSPDQLNTIAEGGNLILFQPTRGSNVVVRHQLTTDRSTIENQEESIISAVDYAAKYYREAMRPFIGKNNITAELLTQLRGIGESVNRALVEGRIVNKGSRFLDLVQNADRPDSVDITVRVQPLYPCNAIDITMNVG